MLKIAQEILMALFLIVTIKRACIGPQRQFAIATLFLIFVGCLGVTISLPETESALNYYSTLVVFGGIAIMLLMFGLDIVHAWKSIIGRLSDRNSR